LLYKSLNSTFDLVDFKPLYTPNFLNSDYCIPVVQQIKQRNINEKVAFYNVCFNHLLNEFQKVFEIAYFNNDNKTALEIIKKMSDEAFKMSEIKFVSEFFDRRNQNSISHTNDQDIGFWGVGQNEYNDYKLKVIDLIKRIYSDIPKLENVL
jgi:hypothetical protein